MFCLVEDKGKTSAKKTTKLSSESTMDSIDKAPVAASFLFNRFDFPCDILSE